MSRKIQVNRLVQDELAYELTIRGIPTGTVQEMRQRLSSAIRLENSGESLRYSNHPYTYEQDAEAVTQKVAYLKAALVEYRRPKSSSECAKYNTQLTHLLGRVERMVATNEEERTTSALLLGETLTLMEMLEERSAEAEGDVEDAPVNLNVLEEGVFNQGVASERRSTPGRQGNISYFSAQHTAQSAKSTPPSKWNLKFSGDKKGLSLNAFLEKANELCLARHVSPSELLNSKIDIFEGRACTFYRAVRGSIETWEEFIKLFRDEFHPADYNEILLEEIKRTQGPDESSGIYLAIMDGFFRRMTCKISEEVKLKIILRNLQPFYQQQLALVDVKSILE